MPKPTPWPAAAKDFVISNAVFLSDREMAATLSRILGRPFTRWGVICMRHALGLKKKTLGPKRAAQPLPFKKKRRKPRRCPRCGRPYKERPCCRRFKRHGHQV